MITFKRFDWIFQMILILGSPLFFLVNQKRLNDFEFVFSYFLVGGWQLISIIVHMFYPAVVKHKLRTLHGILTLILLVVTGILMAIDNETILMFLIGVLFVTPALAILYVIACYLETKALLLPTIPHKE